MGITESVERCGLAISLHSPMFFENVVRPQLYRNADNSPNQVHRNSIAKARQYKDVFANYPIASRFPELATEVAGIKMIPFGTAAGMDKDAMALEPFSHAFGFLTVGTVLPLRRPGNDEPNIAVVGDDVYNAQSFPSMGLANFVSNVSRYRMSSASPKPIVASICALPYLEKECGVDSFISGKNRIVTGMTDSRIVYKEFGEIEEDKDKALENSMEDARVLVNSLSGIVDIFEWNVFSPNTSTLPMMRKPDVIEEYSLIVGSTDKPALMKVGPYEAADRDINMEIYTAWMKHGSGFTGVNTLPTKNPPIADWKHGGAGRSGAALQAYRDRFVYDVRCVFPEAVIFATGGIDSGEEAYRCFEIGADAVEGYTPYTKKGLGLLRQQMSYVSRQMRREGHNNLEGLKNSRDLF